MATNRYLQKQGSLVESSMIESITTEAIQWGGLDVHYIPRTLNKFDQIYGEDVLSSFEVAIPIEMYLDSVNGWEGEGQMISKFGLELRDSATLSVSKSRFENTITPFLGDRKAAIRPQEGDLIYIPVTKSLFEIRFVDGENPFFQTGKRFIYKLSVEKFQFNQEEFNTGNPEIDDRMNKLNTNTIDATNGLHNHDVFNNPNSPVTYGDNDKLKQEFLDIATFNENNPFGDEF